MEERSNDCSFNAHEWQMVSVDVILDWQQRGAAARTLGLKRQDNPLLKYQPARNDRQLQDWVDKVDAWRFGWDIENAMRA